MTAGSLPTGLSPITSGGLLSGTPTTPGTFTFTVTATDANGCKGLQAYTVTIDATPVTSVPTLNEWGAILFMVLAGLGSIYYLRKYRKV
jgi:carbohydrate-binding DOMON domain-containing protein